MNYQNLTFNSSLFILPLIENHYLCIEYRILNFDLQYNEKC
jgi:hypothetical protein